MRQLTAYASYLDNLGVPLVGRARFYNFDDSPAVVYGLDNAHQNYVELGHIVYTNSSGQLVPQVFLADHDYLVVFDKYIGGGTMAEDDNPDNWPEQGSAVDKYNTVGIELDGAALRTADTISSLRSLTPTNYPQDTKEIVTLLGYNIKGDKPEINYIWDAYSNENDNGGSIIKVEGIAVGRWVLVDCPRYLDVRHFGAFPKSSSDQDDIQCGRIQLAGAYAHSNNCGLYFYGDSLNAYYDISGLTLYDIDADDDAMVFAMNGTESTLRDVVNIHCATNQYTEVADQGKINLYGETLKTSFAPRYNVWFGNDSKSVRTIIDSDVQTSHLDIWDVIVEVTVPTTSHWIFHNAPIESIHCIGNNVTFSGWARLARDMFRDNTDGMDFSTVAISGDGIVIDIDDFKSDVRAWCKLVKQQSRREFDMKGYTLDSDCDLSFNDGSTLTLMNATLSGFSSAMNLTLKSCRGSLNYPQARTLQLDGCSEGLIISSINQNASINSRYSRIQLNTVIMTVDSLIMLGGHISSSSTVLSVKGKFEAMDTKVYCKIEAGELLLTDCVVLYDVAGKTVTARSCIFSDVNVDAYSPYNDSDRNVITVEATGNKFLGSSKLRLRTTYSSGSITVYDLSFNVCGNFSDHDFVDDSAFNGVTHNVNVSNCVYKGNYGGCPSSYGYIPETVNYSKETLEYVQDMSTGPNGTVPASQANNTVKFYIDQRTNPATGWTMNTMWWCLKVNKSLSLDSFNVFRFKNIHVASTIRIRPNCKCTFKLAAPSGESYGENMNEVPMRAVAVNVTSSYQYSDSFAVDYGIATTAVGQREQQLLTAVIGPILPQAEAYIEWNVDLVGFLGY